MRRSIGWVLTAILSIVGWENIKDRDVFDNFASIVAACVLFGLVAVVIAVIFKFKNLSTEARIIAVLVPWTVLILAAPPVMKSDLPWSNLGILVGTAAAAAFLAWLTVGGSSFDSAFAWYASKLPRRRPSSDDSRDDSSDDDSATVRSITDDSSTDDTAQQPAASRPRRIGIR